MQPHRTKVNPQAIASGSVDERGFILATVVRLHRQRGGGRDGGCFSAAVWRLLLMLLASGCRCLFTVGTLYYSGVKCYCYSSVVQCFPRCSAYRYRTFTAALGPRGACDRKEANKQPEAGESESFTVPVLWQPNHRPRRLGYTTPF